MSAALSSMAGAMSATTPAASTTSAFPLHHTPSSYLLGTSKEFHNMLVKYTEFILKDIAKEFNINYADLSDRYIVKCFRAPPAKKHIYSPTTIMPAASSSSSTTMTLV